MTQHVELRWIRRIAAATVSLGFLASLASTATSETPAEVSAEPKGVRNFGGSSPLLIPAAAFATTGFTPDSYVFNTHGYIGGTSSFGCLRAPAYLPDGARVSQLAASMADMNSADDMSVSLVRTNNATLSLATEMARVTSSDSTIDPTTRWYVDMSISGPEVSYPQYSYYVYVCVPDFLFQLHQVQIDYVDDIIFRDGFESGGGTGYSSPLSISPSDFKPDGSQAGEVLISPTEGMMYGANYANSRFMHAPVWLPEGATITQVTARVVDNDAGGGGAANCESGADAEIQLWLNRTMGCSAAFCYDEVASASTTGAGPAIQFLTPGTIAFPTVETGYAYFVVMRLCGPWHRVYGVRISYTTP